MDAVCFKKTHLELEMSFNNYGYFRPASVAPVTTVQLEMISTVAQFAFFWLWDKDYEVKLLTFSFNLRISIFRFGD